MKIQPDEIISVIREEVARYRSQLDVARVGRVLEVGDGIAQLFGLSDAMAGELLEFESGAMGQVFNLEENAVGAVIYSGADKVAAGDAVRATGKLLEVPVGEEMLGRVIDPLGEPLDGQGPIAAQATRLVNEAAPGIAEREPVTVPLQTGLKAVDSMTPIGRGQRELIIGDRKTGKTAIALDAIINQRDTGVICVYVAVGQKESTVAAVVESLAAHDAMGHTIVVSAASSQPAPMQYIAPYAGCAIAEHFMLQGRDTLIVYDDLTKQAAAYRQISLLLRRPPGREAYPGDVFYLHSRLLERACKMATRYVIVPSDTREDARGIAGVDGKVYHGPMGKIRAEKVLLERPDHGEHRLHALPGSGGSMTALPICETQEGEVSAYIPTNLIGITDGQLYLEPSLFFAGVRPAINVGISVSRVGYKAAIPAMKSVAASLRLDLAAFRELESFAQLGMELDEATQRRLDRGRRLVKLLTQPQFEPMKAIDQAISINAGVSGALDTLDEEEVAAFEKGLLAYIQSEHADLYQEIVEDKSLPKPRQRRLRYVSEEYRDTVYAEAKRARRKRAESKVGADAAATPEPTLPNLLEEE